MHLLPQLKKHQPKQLLNNEEEKIMAKLTQEDILAYLEEATILELNDLFNRQR